ncbi:uncharacterized protein LOC113216620 [Frankliniella occidentalis]|uniref:Uncharacterized protein LOC113216620 n=1 Tax=Frankliniella occidentalis TaxID=133901 RepID=A0A6J1TFT4_FRAOC|nr:uncharacterized protein LOC113216620 [Frankliniella occidentalis]
MFADQIVNFKFSALSDFSSHCATSLSNPKGIGHPLKQQFYRNSSVVLVRVRFIQNLDRTEFGLESSRWWNNSMVEQLSSHQCEDRCSPLKFCRSRVTQVRTSLFTFVL